LNTYLKIIFKKYFYTFLIIIIGSLLLLSLMSCKPGAYLETDGTFVEKESSPASFTGSTLELTDVNGGDLYPGEAVRANISIVNSGAADDNIEVKLIIDDLLLADPGPTSFVIESPGAGLSIEHSISLKVIEELTRDTPVSALLSINEGKDSEFLTNEVGLLAFGVQPYMRERLPIIGLHAIEDEIEIPIELYTHHFNALCQTLKSFGFETITFKDLMDHLDYGRVLPEKSVIITSDDGFGDLYTNAFPILKKYDYKMTIFLVTDFIKETEDSRVVNYFDADRPVPMRPMLIWPEVREMYDYGCEFLSHSANHIRLGLADDEEFLSELISSREDIESHLNSEVLLFAWPYDNHSKEKIPLLPEAGYRGAVRYWGGIENLNTIDISNIRRVEFNSYIPPIDYAGYLDLLDLNIENSLDNSPKTAGEQFVLEYTIINNDNFDLEITSFELKIENLELNDVDPSGYISQYPGKVDDTFMWVSDDYKIDAGGQIDLILKLSGSNPGNASVKLGLTTYNTYFRAEDIEINIQ
jgi:peptidoglycan/xylan/chitin deacetylase (PgdA/CDA1 family)